MKKSCVNCISFTCKGHENYLGEVPVTECVRYSHGVQALTKSEFEEWAKADGFNCVEEAVEFFEKHYGTEWGEIPMTVIKWDNSKRVLK